jgi:2-polyprenyl-3-methyl-5-hydroxy-6-metoxy-1,4-benzoquinol methylase
MDAAEHPMVVAALARLSSSGGWARVLEGKPLEDALDLVDADLLVSARVIAPQDVGYVVLRKESYLSDPAALHRTMMAQLQRALLHARSDGSGWTGEDLDLVRNQGHGSAAWADLIADDLLHSLPAAATALRSGRGRFLDVGTGVAAISRALCGLFDGLTCLGLDVLPHVLRLAREEVHRVGLEQRIELRHESVAELGESDEFDLAWVPQIFIPRAELEAGLERVLHALRPGGAVIVPTTAPPGSADQMEQAVMVHAGHVLGGGPIDVPEAHRMLTTAGYVEVRDHDYGGQVVMTAVRPRPSS